jgi:tyrosine aminotransferase
MEALIDENTRAILINNPSNPCGSNFSKEHLTEIVAVAEKYNLPIIADEIYSGLVFDGEFNPIQTVRKNVPLLTVGGASSRFHFLSIFASVYSIHRHRQGVRGPRMACWMDCDS